MTVHKLTAGDGYTYLTRQVAAHDATNRGYDNLGEYYSEKGEAPGLWMGRGLARVPDFPVGTHVTEAQMVALFGEGRHPNADQIERAATTARAHPWLIDQASRLGAPYRIHEQANMFSRRCAGAFRDHNITLDLEENTPVPAADRARLRTELARTMFTETYGREPVDARELSGHLARISRQATTAVAGYDLSFSPVKSVSTLWAVAPPEIAEVIEQAHHDAVRDTLTWLEEAATYTRRGRHGVAQVDVKGLIAAAFTHRDSRAGDPDLHTHVAISNKVQALDGQWLALDGRPLYRNGVAASERYNTRIEALLIERLGVQFADRPGADPSKRPVREIVGIDGPLPRQWSTRRVAIDVRRAVLSAQFQTDYGRPPNPKEALSLAQQANNETRQNKHAPRSYADQRASWRSEALAVLGGEQGLSDYLQGAIGSGRRRDHTPPTQQVTRSWVEQTATRVLSTVQSARATWQVHHVRAEAERQARAAGIALADVDRAVEAVVTAALSPARSMSLQGPERLTGHLTETVPEPALLRRTDGSSVYTVAGSTLYTSTQIVAAEQAIVAAGARRDGRVVSAHAVDLALLESSANGVDLNPGQVQLVRELACSGARLQLALAPAGTGKTTAMRVLSRSWTSTASDGTRGGTVIGLAPSAAAAAVLRTETGARTDTLAKLIHALHSDNPVPDWVQSIGPDTLVVIDEAGMAGTADLATAITYVLGRGGSVRLIGDDQQLAAIGAGGVLRDIADTHGAVTLTQVMRFTHPDTGAPNHAEGAASLALRDGDPAALGYYIDNSRVHVGDNTTVTEQAYTAWTADRAAGRDAIMLAPTRDLVVELNRRARSDRLAQQPGPTGPQATLADGTQASIGDAIITRKNNRTLAITATDWVKNGDRWQVEAVHQTGALDVKHLRTGRHLTLPADYVADHVSLGYATTVHGAQGITADVAHTVATGQETRQLLYVAMTRGRNANHVYLSTAGDGDPHSVITRDALLPPTAVNLLTRLLARDGSPVSATSQGRALADPATRLHADADRYHHALATAAEDHLGPAKLTAIDQDAATAAAGLTGCEAYPTLRAHLALLATDGHDPGRCLARALASGPSLEDARDVAAILDWRLDPAGNRAAGGPLPWLPAIPAALASHPEWGLYLRDRAEHVQTDAAQVHARAWSWTPTSAPPWATSLITRDHELVVDLAVWRAAQAVEDGDRRPTGPPQPAAAEARAQRALDLRVTKLLGDPRAATARWAPLANQIDPRITADPYWPVLADRLAIAARAGINIDDLTRAVGSERALPDEQPAAALWWRLARHLSPAAMTATQHSLSDTLRPDWTPVLTDLLGTAAAHQVLADPAWPALVAAVSHARSSGWEPEQLLSTTHDLLCSGHPDDEPLRTDELATALIWRIGVLIDRDQFGQRNPSAEEPDWLANLVEPDDAEEAPFPDPDFTPTLLDPINTGGAVGVVGGVGAGLPATEVVRGDVRLRAETTYPLDATVFSRTRLLELNTEAARFFTARYADSWAPAYLAERLGRDLIDDERFRVGYAPASWTALTDHLRSQGATDQQIIAAGLGSVASTGRVIDRFRDRLLFPILGTSRESGPDGLDNLEILGWIGRRNPNRTEQDNAGPKYLNTPETPLFIKGHQLYGLAENAAALADGAIPVLVEGPMDALAVTLAGDRRFVGVAPLGTAFTDTQADALQPYLGPGRPGIIVATDNDRAGQQAARRAFWQLTARGDNPRHLMVPHGKDPAELLQTAGPAALRRALEQAPDLADTLINAQIALFTERLNTVEGSVLATRQAAHVVAALPMAAWPRHLTTIVGRTGVGADTALNEVFDAHQEWTADTAGVVRQRLSERFADYPTSPATAPTHPSKSPNGHWTALGEGIAAGLTQDPHWEVLADHLQRAQAAGFNVATQLPRLASRTPLPDSHVARNLDLRLIAAWPSCLPTTNRAARTGGQERTATAKLDTTTTYLDTAEQNVGGPELPSTTPTPAPQAEPTHPRSSSPARHRNERERPGPRP